MADNGATTPPTPPNAPAQQALAQGAEQEKIAVHVRDQSGQELTFKIRKQTLLEKVMDTFSQKLGKAKGTLRFFHDGDRINVGDTPESVSAVVKAR